MTRSSRRRQSAAVSEGLLTHLYSPFLLANVALLVFALCFGGASRLNYIPVTILEMLSLLILPWAAFRAARQVMVREMIWPLCIWGAIVLVPIIQLIPLPPSIWLQLPGADLAKSAYAAAGIPNGPRSASLTPEFTIRSALSLIPPFTVFLSWITLSSRERRVGIVAILAITIVSLLLGAFQLALGGDGVGYLYEVTNHGSLVGFFANRNHQAALLLCALPLTAAFVTTSDQFRVKSSTLAILALGLTLVVILALAAVQSRSGILLLGPVLVGCILLLLRSGRFGRPKRLLVLSAALLIVPLGVILTIGLNPLLARFEHAFGVDNRFLVAPDVWGAAIKHLPVGSGLGSFDVVYRSVERLEFVQPAFLNHAHNDYLELFLEAGLLAVLIFGAFLAWFFQKSLQAWRTKDLPARNLARAASIVIATLLLHSIVDYPLRTIALSSIFALSCALLCATPKHPRAY